MKDMKKEEKDLVSIHSSTPAFIRHFQHLLCTRP